ncbi:MAG TPA: hypothetical protein VGE74_01740 [Gemmata sp.]
MLIVFSALVCLAPAHELPSGRAERELALDEFSARQAEAVDQVLELAREAMKSPKTRADAAHYVRVLGRMRSPRAIDFLVSNLTFQPLAGAIAISTIPSTEQSLPSVYGLTEIGSACFPALLAKLQESDDEFTLRCGAAVFRDSLGADQAPAYLRRAASKLPAGPKRTRIESVATWVEKLK